MAATHRKTMPSNHPLRPNALLLASLTAMTSACSSPPPPAPASPAPPKVGMANPASAYCLSLGGRLDLRKDESGNQFGICHLPDGTLIEEWVLFRRDHPQRRP